MKLQQLFEQSKELLTEGLRFGRREKKLVDLESRDILVGVEYEYHVDEDHAGSFDEEGYDEAVWEKGQELQDEFVESEKKDYIEGYADNDMSEFNVENTTANLYSIKKTYTEYHEPFQHLLDGVDEATDAFADWDRDDLDNGMMGFQDKRDIENVVKFLKAYQELQKPIHGITSDADAIEYDEQLERVEHYLPGNGSDIGSDWDEFKENMNTVEDFYDEHDDDIEKLIKNLNPNMQDLFPKELQDALKASIENVADDASSVDLQDIIEVNDTMLENIKGLSGTDSEWDSDIKEGFQEGAEDLWDDGKEHVLGFDPDDGLSDEYREEAYEHVDRSDYGGDGGEPEDVVDTMLRDSSNSWNIDWNDIRNVTTDASVSDDVETITKAIPFKEALKLMENMFEHISEIGSTSTSTGMHVNMSIKGLQFKRDNFNPTKLAMLMDERYLKQETKFPVRSYVASMFSEFGISSLFAIASEYAETRSIEKTLELFEEIAVPTNVKHKFINFNNITDNTDTTAQRIEFRFFGGEGYEDKYEEMEQDMYRAAYMMMVAYSEEFGKKEYFNEILDFLNRSSEDMAKMSFFDAVKVIKETGITNLNEFNDLIQAHKTKGKRKQTLQTIIDLKSGRI